jgi:hypothetical protein
MADKIYFEDKDATPPKTDCCPWQEIGDKNEFYV